MGAAAAAAPCGFGKPVPCQVFYRLQTCVLWGDAVLQGRHFNRVRVKRRYTQGIRTWYPRQLCFVLLIVLYYTINSILLMLSFSFLPGQCLTFRSQLVLPCHPSPLLSEQSAWQSLFERNERLKLQRDFAQVGEEQREEALRLRQTLDQERQKVLQAEGNAR